MAYNFAPFKQSIKDLEDWLKKEFSSIRTGRATPAILDGVFMESYGTKMPISQVGSVAIEGARSLRIAPWDSSQIKGIEKAIITSNLGLSVAVDDRGLRITFPELTTESRNTFIKIAKQKLEESRVTLRAERDKVWNDIQAHEKEGGMGEDEKFRLKDEMQKIVDEAGGKLEALAIAKEKEMMS
ncbi:ribosome recycling factor [Candidatus Parcubacteria bacterium]|nr:ribosome recycling factor [Candidatus Parcubacteria bacterium]